MKTGASGGLGLHDLVDEGRLFRRVGDLGAAHFGDVVEGGLRVKAEVGEDGAGEHARAADAGVAVEGCVFAVLYAGGDSFGECGESFGIGQVHVADGM